MSESSSKKRTHTIGSPPSVRRTRRFSAEKSTPSATPQKREKTKKSKESQKVLQQKVIFIIKLLLLSCVFDG